MEINVELAQCAQLNFENLAKDVPAITQHPFWLIAKAQLDEALGGQSIEESLKPHLKKTEIRFENGKAIVEGEDIIADVIVDGESILNTSHQGKLP